MSFDYRAFWERCWNEMVYADGTPRSGMLFRPYDEQRLAALIGNHPVVLRENTRKGDRIVLLQKQ